MTASLRKTLADVQDGLRTQPGRSGLAVVSIGIGMTALTILLSALMGLQARSRQLVREFGAQVVAIVPAPPADSARRPLDLSDADLLAANLPDCSVSASRRLSLETAQGQPLAVVATDERLFAMRPWRLVAGRFLDARDTRYGERHAVVTADLARRPGWEPGRAVMIRGVPLTIVGVIDAGAAALPASEAGGPLMAGERTVYVPLRVARAWSEAAFGPERLDAVLVRAQEGQDLDRIVETCARLLAQRADSPPVAWVTSRALVEGIRRLQAAIGLSVGAIVVLCVVLGGVILMTVMVANVRQRVTEIGLRRAMGATGRDIASMFVLEGCLVSGVAAVAGAGVAHILLWGVGDRYPLPLQTGWATVLTPLALSLILGALFSLAPARSAALLSPADSLRSE